MMELTKSNLQTYAATYDEQRTEKDRTVEEKMKMLLATQRFLTLEEFIEIGMWKSTRPKKWYESNNEETVREITTFSFSAKTEQARVGSLFVLRGVSYPVASVLLHFAFPERYPILDFRALWSLGWEQPNDYRFDFWMRYCIRFREVAQQFGLPLRIVDKALWQYSSDHQGKSTAAAAG